VTDAFPLRAPKSDPPGAHLARKNLELAGAEQIRVETELRAEAAGSEGSRDIHILPSSNPQSSLSEHADSVFFALARSVEERDQSLGRHCERLALMSSAIGLLLGLPTEAIRTLNKGGYVHDIGKVTLPDSILLKPAPLNAKEWALMKTHPVRGEEICRHAPSLEAVLPIVRHHHEHWDGSGYPDGLKGEEIPLLARILQMADIYDALTSERPYKKAFSPQTAIQIMQHETLKGWRDPKLMPVVEAALPLFESGSFWEMGSLSLGGLAASLRGWERPAVSDRL
jgi:putative two-component system response regulator